MPSSNSKLPLFESFHSLAFTLLFLPNFNVPGLGTKRILIQTYMIHQPCAFESGSITSEIECCQ